MNYKSRLKKSTQQALRQFMAAAFATAMLFALPVASNAQETTSSIQGTVSDGAGNGVSGANISVYHAATGTRRSTRTSASGNYRLPNLRVGGPYEVTLAGTSEYGEEKIVDVYVTLGEPYSLNLVTRTTSIEEIVVSASQQDIELQTGAGSSFDRDNIDGMANVNRDFKNIIRQNPLVSIDPTNSDAVSIAGTNNRFNSLTVDGVRQNDDFGLNNSGLPTQRSPVSIDAIEQIVVSISPFDVSYGGFTGGTINAVTKSGTNEWDGSIAFYNSNEDLLGDKSENDNIDLGNFDQDTTAFTLSGPIVKDRLWFFASYDEYTATDTSALDFGPAGSGRPTEVTGVTQAEIDEVIRISRDVYGFEAGSLPDSGTDIKDEKLLVKLDWAINDNHQATVTFQDVTGNALNTQGSSGFSNRIGLSSNWYDKSEEMESISGQLFSYWTDDFSTEIKVASKEITTGQNSLFGTDNAQMTISTPTGGSIRVGPDIFRHSNSLANDQLQFKLKGEYRLDRHTISAGFERDEFDIFNVFAPRSEGEYTFGSIVDFEARIANSYNYSNAFSNNKADAAATFEYQINSFYIQDVMDINDNLTIQFGIRYDDYSGSDTPVVNPNFVARNGFSNAATLDGRDVIMPRASFIYDFDSGMRVRGGVGLFSGGNPNVWISNSFTNDGVTIVNPDNTGAVDPTCAGVLSSAATLTNVDAFDIPAAVQACMFSGAGDVEATDPNFDIPSTWRFNVAVERDFDLGFLGDSWLLSAEAVVSEVNDTVEWTELRRTQIATAPDGRPIYDTPPNYDILLTNSGQGNTTNLTLAAQKAWDTRAGLFDVSLAYTFMDAEEVNPAQSSTASSNYGRTATFDRNNRQLSRSDFEIENRFVATFGWQKDLFGDNMTRVSGFFEWRTGKPFSYTMREGTGDTSVYGGDRDFARRDSQLLYVPLLNDPNVIFNNNTQDLTNDPALEANFNAFIAAAGLEGFRGQILPRNHDENDDRTRLDIRISQEIGLTSLPVLGESQIVLFADIENFGNLLNSDWGRVDQVTFPFNATAVGEVSLNANGQYVYGSFDDFAGAANPETLQNGGLPSVWKIQLGIKVEF